MQVKRTRVDEDSVGGLSLSAALISSYDCSLSIGFYGNEALHSVGNSVVPCKGSEMTLKFSH